MTARKRRPDLLEVWLELFEKIEGPRRRGRGHSAAGATIPFATSPNRSPQLRALGSFR